MGLDTYLQKYDDIAENAKLSDREDFRTWTLELPGDGPCSRTLLCCPEDFQKDRRPHDTSQRKHKHTHTYTQVTNN